MFADSINVPFEQPSCFFFFLALLREKISEANRNSLNDVCSVPFNAPTMHQHVHINLYFCIPAGPDRQL